MDDELAAERGTLRRLHGRQRTPEVEDQPIDLRNQAQQNVEDGEHAASGAVDRLGIEELQQAAREHNVGGRPGARELNFEEPTHLFEEQEKEQAKELQEEEDQAEEVQEWPEAQNKGGTSNTFEVPDDGEEDDLFVDREWDGGEDISHWL